jgi:hypothetical protein
MPENAKPPTSRRLQARVFRVVNVPIRFILGLPLTTPLGRIQLGTDGSFDRDSVARAVQDGFRVVRWDAYGSGVKPRNSSPGRPASIRPDGT